MLRVSLTEHKTKQEVLKVANTTSSSLPAIINEKKMPVFWTRNKSVRGRSKNCQWKTKLQGREDGGNQTLPG